MPAFVERKTSVPAIEATTIDMYQLEMVPRNCTLAGYEKLKTIRSVNVTDEIVAYASPDSTYAVTKRFFDAAKKSIRIGIYDFSSSYIKKLTLDAMSRGVQVTLMLDVDGKSEERVMDSLAEMGANCVTAPACSSQRANYFSSCHEKFIVIDDVWTLVQSGNYSDNSIPLNEVDGGDPENFKTGNRDTGLAIKSRRLAAFFTSVLNSDIELELNGAEALAAERQEPSKFLVEAAPTKIPKSLFNSKSFQFSAEKPLIVQPVLSPDNYMDVMPNVLRMAKKSILIEQQYIRGTQPQITVLLQAIAEAIQGNPDLDVRIVLGKLFDADAVVKEKKNLAHLKNTYGLALGPNIRFINEDRFVHCHNKLIIVDGKTVLVSSQNWSDSAVSKNREAGILLTHRAIGTYFSKIFESDWETAVSKIPNPGKKKVGPEMLRKGGFVRVAAADYRVV